MQAGTQEFKCYSYIDSSYDKYSIKVKSNVHKKNKSKRDNTVYIAGV